MVFSDTTDKSGLIQDCEFWLFSAKFGSITDYPERMTLFTTLINRAFDETAAIILSADTRWQWDDSRYTTFPIGTKTLVQGQSGYEFDGAFLKIISVEVRDANGDYYPLRPIDQEDLRRQGLSLSTRFKNNGKPMYYDKTGNFVNIYPAPLSTSVTTSLGLRVYFQREPRYFSDSDTTAEPGFPRTHHRLLSMKASLDYALANNDEQKVGILNAKVRDMEQSLVELLSKREKDERKSITMHSTPAY